MQRKPNFDIKMNKVYGPVKYRSRAPGQGACLKGMSRTITLQSFTFLALTNVEKTNFQRKC